MALVHRDIPAEGTPAPSELGTALAALTDPDPARRHRAALDLHGVPEAVPALLARVGEESDPAVREAVLIALAGHDTVDVARCLADHLASDDAALRTAVAKTLAGMPAGMGPLLGDLVAHPEPDVRIMTALVLADLPDPRAADWLTRMVTVDRHPNVVASAVDALLPLAGEEHVEPLRAVAERFPNDPFLCFAITAALPRLAEVRT